MHKISNEDLQAIMLLEQNTGAHAKDVVLGEDAVIFVVEKGELGKAIGKQGANIARLRRAFGKEVQLVEEASDLKLFLANLFAPAKIMEVKQSVVEEKMHVVVVVEHKDKGLAIGRGGERVKKARLLAKRHFDVEDLKIV